MAPLEIPENLLSLFLKRSCPVCGGERDPGETFCEWCSLRLDPCSSLHRSIDGRRIPPPVTGNPKNDYDTYGIPVYSAVLFAGLPGELIRRLKFGGERHLASAAAKTIRSFSPVLPGPGHLLVPVPVSRRRKRERGYDQALLIGRAVARLTGCRLLRALSRDHGPSQVGLSNEQRRDNVRGVFHVSGRRRVPPGGTVCLLDDVATTFSTIHNAAGALLENGAGVVYGLTLAYRRKAAGSIIRNELTIRTGG
ncbi:MAG: hypothetical protein AVO35_05310 [Candidatus Aegiribacteria sp. MLS_C]|nr:MAG: hypothetical protein AVO35_05310 [Candidatus Aegiribacteria sp. MLS_C]